jgi:Tripartite tricarboxylate transporter TctB family
MGRALLAWLALVVCGLLIEPLGFLLAGEVLVLLVIVVIERIRSIPVIVTLLLLPPAMYFLFDTLLEVQLPGGTLWY